MSRHTIVTDYMGSDALVIMGWDQPMQGFFMYAQSGSNGQDSPDIYDNLTDVGIIPSLQYFLDKLKELDITIPQQMINEIIEDAEYDCGNKDVYHLVTDDGEYRREESCADWES